jgi:glycosyltransferase involved in cell wall biosynthesis
MKIVEVCPYDMSRPGGVQTHIRDLSNWLRAQGHEVRILAPRTPTSLNEPNLTTLGHARKIGFQGSQFEISYVSRKDLNHTVAAMRDFDAELVHLHTPWTPLMAWQVWRALQLPSVATFHATIPEQDSKTLSTRLLFRTAKYFMSRTGATIVPSTAPLAALSHLNDRKKITVLPPSIDLSDWRNAGLNGHKSNGDAKSILYLGRLEPRKGIKTMLNAWPLIAHALPHAVLTIAGGGEMEAEVLAAQKASDGRLVFIHQPDRKAVLALAGNADLMLATAEYGESFGLILLEAMAAGIVPIVAANSGYTTLMTGQGSTLLYQPGDTHGLAQKTIALAKNAKERQAMQKWGREQAENFGLEQVGPKFEQIFERAIAQAR